MNNLIQTKFWYKNYLHFMKNFFGSIPKSQIFLFVLLDAFLSSYIVFTRYLAYSTIFISKSHTLCCLIFSILILIIVFHLLIYICWKLRSFKIRVNNEKSKLNLKLFIISFSICIFILSMNLLAYYPGGVSNDNCTQWDQVQNFRFDNWHPAIHTFLIYLITRIYNHYSFVIFVQILIFSIGVALLICDLKSWGIKNICLTIVYGLIVINMTTRNIMMYAWKDTALTILILFIFTHTINIYLSNGLWLRKYTNLIGFSICIALATLIRHNGFFYTLPLLALILYIYVKNVREVLYSAILSVILILAIRFPLYSSLKVTYPDQGYVESVGLPMTIMCNVMKNNPDALSEKTKSFLNEIATDQQWKTKYKSGNYNSVKFAFNTDRVIKKIPIKDFIKMTINTIISDKRNSFIAALELTCMVWETKGDPKGVIYVANEGNPIKYEYKNTKYNKLGKIFINTIYDFSNLPILNKILMMIGIHILFLMIFGLISYYKNGIKSLIFVVPTIIYNLGTMLLLCGEDYRFFQFNCVIFITSCLMLFAKNINTSKKSNIKK